MFKKESKSTRELIGIEEITDYSIKTKHKEIVYFKIKPSNLSVMSESSVEQKIHSLMTLLKGVPNLQMLCLNSKENFDENTAHIKRRIENEINPNIRKLLELDSKYLDKIQVTMSSAREFFIVVKLDTKQESDILPYLSRIEKAIKDSGFIVNRANKDEIKTFLSVYFEQNVSSEKYDDFDGGLSLLRRDGTECQRGYGERWVI